MNKSLLLTMPSLVAPFSGFPLWKSDSLKSSEATAKNPPCGEAKTAQNNNQNFFEVFRIGTERKEILTSQTAELKQT